MSLKLFSKQSRQLVLTVSIEVQLDELFSLLLSKKFKTSTETERGERDDARCGDSKGFQ